MQSFSTFLADEAATVAFGQHLQEAILATEKSATATRDCAYILYLNGDLGSGKTTLSRGLVRAFGHSGAVKSPTYTLVEPYEFETLNVYHFDLYRLSHADEVDYLGVEDYFDSGSICIIEWPQRGEPRIPKADLLIDILIEDGGRRLQCQAKNRRGEVMLQHLQGQYE
ncbi:MAG: tRNA (adenosine(37)-N6)-threonylcarbamoyltransferase complex ATPase subunit type 1 TsaE [SAR86 cluster bacterium]|uniref:tRNA threonylcarbamoyladenosine biosynthesis protein TsaE n=1 Tax=SAR86 cluster bacterium TaxID=2030880 RepID=A0A2A4MIS5_9GAMM|nr:MAG: tRNA (adenosine(37)-N6)-threonylcarbamoyltransferase complex ATPase subunit type 1 TsaE [SAR86 cluster bacterium]